MEQTNAQQRAKWVARWKDSGLTAKEFAAEAGLTVSALYNWSSQLSAAKQKHSGIRFTEACSDSIAPGPNSGRDIAVFSPQFAAA